MGRAQVHPELKRPEDENRKLREENRRLREENRELKRIIHTLQERLEEHERRESELQEKVVELQNRLRRHENPHTPPSQRKRRKKKGKKKKSTPKKQGAPKGHTGATRETPEPDEVIDVPADRCPRCNHELGEPIGTETHIIEDIPPPRKITVTQYELARYECPHCGHAFTATHEDCPQEGRFGIHVLSHITLLKFHLRGVIRKVQDSLQYNNAFPISTKGIHDILLRVGRACRNEYQRLQQKVRDAQWLHIDETGIKVNGDQRWLWIFRTDDNEVLTVIRNSRGSQVLTEILGSPDIPAVVDGWTAYNKLEVVQRGWAHLLREVDDLTDTENGQRLSEEIHRKFDELKEFLGKDPPMEERKLQKETWDQQMRQLVERYSQFEELQKPVTYIQNGLGDWYTCLLYPGMEPTNNLAEQAIREHVIMEKIIGTFRSERGAKNYQYIASVLATWKLQGKNLFEELENLLRQELCLS